MASMVMNISNNEINAENNKASLTNVQNLYIENLNTIDNEKEPPTFHGFRSFNLETFVGRKGTAKTLLRLIKEHKRVLITGIGGIGKTSLATYCAILWAEEQKKFEYAVIVNMETDESAKNCFYQLAKDIFSENTHNDCSITKVYNAYNKKKSLFIMDNIEQNEENYKYWPGDNLKNIYILGTSQCIEFKTMFKLFPLEILSRNDSVELITKTLKHVKNQKITIKEQDNKLLEKLVEELGYHPLALEQAAAFLVDNIVNKNITLVESITEYLDQLTGMLENKLPNDFPTYYRTPVYMALRMNIDKAIKDDVYCRNFLFCLSYLEPNRIDIRTFNKHKNFGEDVLKDVIRQLSKYSIIHAYTYFHIYISLHRLVQEVTRTFINKKEKYNTVKLLIETLFLDFSIFSTYTNHYEYFVKNTKINREKLSAIYIELFRQNAHIMETLTSKLKQISCDIDDINTWSILHYCAYARHDVLFDHFHDKNVMMGSVNKEWSLFHVDMLHEYNHRLPSLGNRCLFEFLRSNNDQINRQSVKDFTFLNFAVACNIHKYDIIALIKLGCDVNIPDVNGNKPIDRAIRNGRYDIGYELIRAGSTYSEIIDKNLLCASVGGDSQLTVAFINQGANVNITDDQGCSPLSLAIDHGHCNVVLALIEGGVDVNTSSLQMPLIHAIDNAYCDIAMALIEGGADVNTTDKYGYTPLLFATERRLHDISVTLMEKGADINIRAENGQTPLSNAVKGGYCDIVMALIAKGADVNIGDKNDRTLLSYAVNEGYCDIAIALIEQGADVNSSVNYGYTPLLIATERGFYDISIILMEKGADINIRDKNGKTPLSNAVKGGYCDIVMALIKKGADVNSTDKYGYTPLSIATERGFYDIIITLVEKGADINIRDEKGADINIRDEKGVDVNTTNKYGCKTLLFAIVNGLNNISITLIEKGADINIRDENGQTPLSYAVKGGYHDIAMALIKNGADVNSTDNYGYTPLLFATERGFYDIIITLVEKGADINIRDNIGQTPLSYAIKGEYCDIAVKLIEKGANVNSSDNYSYTPLLLAVNCGYHDVIMALIENGADINKTDENGNTPLSIAIKLNDYDIIMALIKAGADINTSNKYGFTPLSIATRKGRHDLVIELIEKGADINMSENDGRTPLSLANWFKYHNIALTLIERGADINISDENGETPLSIAKKNRLTDVVKELEKRDTWSNSLKCVVM